MHGENRNSFVRYKIINYHGKFHKKAASHLTTYSAEKLSYNFTAFITAFIMWSITARTWLIVRSTLKNFLTNPIIKLNYKS